MNILALESAGPGCSVALGCGSRIFSAEARHGESHSLVVIPLIDDLLARAKIRLGDLDAIAFSAGPGMFSGVRLACGVAQALAYAVNYRREKKITIAAVPTLQALAESAAQKNRATRAAAALCAYHRHLFFAAYRLENGEWREAVAPAVFSADNLPRLDGRPNDGAANAETDDGGGDGGGWLGCGDGFHRCALNFGGAIAAVSEVRWPDARAVLRLAARRAARGETTDPLRAAPIYLRDKIALTVAERRRG